MHHPRPYGLVSDTERFNRPAGKGIDGVRKLVHLGAR